MNTGYVHMLTLTCCQDHILTENIWFVWSETSYSGDERRCHGCGRNEQQTNIEDRATQPMEAGGWVLHIYFHKKCAPKLRINIWTLDRGLSATLSCRHCKEKYQNGKERSQSKINCQSSEQMGTTWENERLKILKFIINSEIHQNRNPWQFSMKIFHVW